MIYGLKGIAAYQYHAMILGHDDPEVTAFIVKALAATTQDLARAGAPGAGPGDRTG